MMLTWRTDAKASQDSRFSLVLRRAINLSNEGDATKLQLHPDRRSQHVSSLRKVGIRPRGHDERPHSRAVVGRKAGNRIARVREHDTCLRSAPGVRLGRAQLFALPRGASGHGASLPAARGAADGFRRRSACSRTTAPAAKSLARRAERTATRQSSRRTSRSRIETPAA
jgi:hypothetical protein